MNEWTLYKYAPKLAKIAISKPFYAIFVIMGAILCVNPLFRLRPWRSGPDGFGWGGPQPTQETEINQAVLFRGYTELDPNRKRSQSVEIEIDRTQNSV